MIHFPKIWGEKKSWRRRGYYLWFIVVLLLGLVIYLFSMSIIPAGGYDYGITFSDTYATELGLDWKDTYISLLDDLEFKNLRLMTYWDEIEMVPGQFNWEKIDWQVQQAAQRQANIIMVVGRRQPRWPECHDPGWLNELSVWEQHQAINNFVKATIEHFKTADNIIAWQVDNEVFLTTFGDCPLISASQYEQRLNLVKSLDSRPIISTESGELSTWWRSARLNNILGVSVYRNTWTKWYGKFYYPLPPFYYYLKAKLLMWLTPLQKVFVSELQLEPWSDIPLAEMELADQLESMNIDTFWKNIRYAQRIGFSDIYLWGGEWWYWLKVKRGDDSFWQAAKQVLDNDNRD
ncbi:MAG: endo-1,4-beta-xylanase [Candidatus Komeilibacteria bacterium]